MNLFANQPSYFLIVFYTEVLENIRHGIANNVSSDNIILEINASKYVCNYCFYSNINILISRNFGWLIFNFWVTVFLINASKYVCNYCFYSNINILILRNFGWLIFNFWVTVFLKSGGSMNYFY